MRIPAVVAFVLAAVVTRTAAAQCSTFANNPPGTNLQLTDDSVRTVGLGFSFPFAGNNYTAITVCSNGYVWLGSVAEEDFGLRGADWLENEPDFLAFGPRLAVCWDDWNPQVGGGVYFRTDGTSASIVWKGVPQFGGTGVLNAELVMLPSGEFFMAYDSSMAAPSDNCMVGITGGGGATSNPIDWSVALPTTITGGTAHEILLTGLFDLTNRIHHFTPTSPAATAHQVQIDTLSTCPPGTYPPLAVAPTAFGVGCPPAAIANQNAIYELFTPSGGANPTDMSGLSLEFVKSGTTYITAAGPGFDTSYLTQGTVVTQFDETIVANLGMGTMGTFPFCNGQFASVAAAANGYLVLQPGGTSDFSPTVAEFLAGPARIAPHWTDYDFTFGGTFYWSNNDPNFCMATWENVEMYAQPGTSNTFQVKLYANGDIAISYGNVASQFDDVLVGITLGNGATDPGASNLSASIGSPVVRDLGSLTLPMTLEASGPAAIAQTCTLWGRNLNGGAIGAFAIGATTLNLDLTGLGMTNCFAYCSDDQVLFQFASGGQLVQSFVIPSNVALFGITVHTQAAAFAPVNPFGLITSNRQTFTLGL